jgi:hypothetical protein
MLDGDSCDSMSIKQVEINTIAVGGCIGSVLPCLGRYKDYSIIIR